jgi:hypothetical protein
MYTLFRQSPTGRWLEQWATAMGYRYAGDTCNGSKAFTNVPTKTIRIKKQLPAKVAALSYAYELSNALQAESYDLIEKVARSRACSRMEYVDAILEHEATSVLYRSRVAREIGLSHLVKNQLYNHIERSPDRDEQKVQAIVREIRRRGTVYQGTITVDDHYGRIFDSFQTPPPDTPSESLVAGIGVPAIGSRA